jgi:hypothetical protein
MIIATSIFIIFIVLLIIIFSWSDKNEELFQFPIQSTSDIKLNFPNVIVAHYNENLDWIENVKYSCIVISRNGLKKETKPNKGNEASIYLEYIIENYNSIADYTVFVHGHRTDWHHKENIDEKLNRLTFDRDYFNINDQSVGKIDDISLDYMLQSKLMTSILNLIDDSIDIRDIRYRCSAQFYVSKDKIQSNPIELYKKMYNLLMKTEETSYWSGRVFEYLWHIIFTKNIIDK